MNLYILYILLAIFVINSVGVFFITIILNRALDMQISILEMRKSVLEIDTEVIARKILDRTFENIEILEMGKRKG